MPGGLHRRRCSGRRSIVIHRRRRRRLQERLVTSQTFGKVGLTLLRRRPDEAEALCRHRLEGVGVAAQAATGGVVQHFGRVGLVVADASPGLCSVWQTPGPPLRSPARMPCPPFQRILQPLVSCRPLGPSLAPIAVLLVPAPLGGNLGIVDGPHGSTWGVSGLIPKVMATGLFVCFAS